MARSLGCTGWRFSLPFCSCGGCGARSSLVGVISASGHHGRRWRPALLRAGPYSVFRGQSRFTAGGLPTPWARAEIGSIYILRGLFKNGRFEATRTEAPALAARILNKDCPVSAELTEDDRVKLRAFQKLNQEGAEK
jgi:hypothetical protein